MTWLQLLEAILVWSSLMYLSPQTEVMDDKKIPQSSKIWFFPIHAVAHIYSATLSENRRM